LKKLISFVEKRGWIKKRNNNFCRAGLYFVSFHKTSDHVSLPSYIPLKKGHHLELGSIKQPPQDLISMVLFIAILRTTRRLISFLFLCNFLLVSMILSLDFGAADHVFSALVQRKQLVPHGPSYGRIERSRTIL